MNSSTIIPYFQYIDTDVGLKYLNNNRELYIKILNNFLNRYRDLKIEILEDGELKDTIHSIKGLSSTLGMVELSKIATTIHETKDMGQLDKFSKVLSLTIEELKSELESKNIKTILIINDKIIDIDILVELLGEKYDVIVALDEKSALDTLEFEEISAIILDSSMQNIDISKLYGNIARRGIPILFIMDGLNENLLQEFSNIDLNGQITKPFHIDKIERSLKLSLRNK